jgi:transcriptional regulator with XRE-family HTH domain
MKKLNIIGRQVGKLRYQRGWTQERLAARLQLAGWIISRSGVSKIENGSMCVHDFRLPFLAKLFGVAIADLYPKTEFQSLIHGGAMQFDFDKCSTIGKIWKTPPN